jgi:hypothetical protein
MCASSDKHNLLVGAAAIQPVDQQKVTTNMALAMVDSIPRKGMV